MKAKKGSWEILPMPEKRKAIPFKALYTGADAENIVNGFIPRQMEDKWFIYYKDNQLYFHRSWTGICVYIVKFNVLDTGMTVSETLINNDKSQYISDDTKAELSTLLFVIECILFDRD